MNKKDLINKIKTLTDLSDSEKAHLIELVNTKKKYGLVWEDKPEEVEEQLRSMLPVLIEDETKAIVNGVEHPNHILIEGDNLHALTALTYTHEGKIDVIYIDPPYNTGNNDFTYHDAFKDKPEFIGKEHPFRHSTWLSFMNKRLLIAKKLLSNKGVIFISIDDNEQAQLKLLCDEIFNANNLLGIVTVAKGTTTGQDAKKFGSSCDYLLVYGMPDFELGKFDLTEKDKKRFSRIDEKGNYAILQFRKTGNNDRRENRPNLFYPLTSPDGNEIFPYGPGGYESTWRGDIKFYNKLRKENMVEWVKQDDGWKPYVKFYMEGRGKAPSNLWTDIEGNKKATIELKDIFGDKIFTNPKPTDLIKKCLEIVSSNEITILDFFAGSGTTLHATMTINEIDEGKRQCILVTNNENNICENITYKRNKRVIQGYLNAKNEDIEGLTNNNLRYYKAEFVPSERTEVNRRKLTQDSTDLLRIKEDCFTNVSEKYNLNEKESQLFTNHLGKYMLVVYHSRNQFEVIEKLNVIIPTIETNEKIKLYAFSPEKETIEEDFYSVADKIEAIPLPDSIYNAYRATFRTLKLDKKQAKPVSESTTEEE
jgi:adenine-specific DNA-methyltransferase